MKTKLSPEARQELSSKFLELVEYTKMLKTKMDAVKPYGEDWYDLLNEHKTVNRMLDVINWTMGAVDEIELNY